MCETVIPHTLSLWTDLLLPEVCAEYRNHDYNPTNTPLICESNQVYFRIWDDFWFQRTPLHAVKNVRLVSQGRIVEERISDVSQGRIVEDRISENKANSVSSVGADLERREKSKEEKVAVQMWDFDSGRDPFA